MSLKIHKNLVVAVKESLSEIFFENKQADKQIESVLKSDKRWGKRDRNFVAETTYDCLRNIRYFNYIFNKETEFTSETIYGIIAVYLKLKHNEIPDWDFFTNVPSDEEIQNRILETQNLPQIKNSYPDWLYQKAQAELGTIWLKEAEALNQTTNVVIRANTLQTSVDKLQQELANLEIETEKTDLAKDALVLKKRTNLKQLDLYKNGFFEVQDVASQNAANFLRVEPGMTVIDACCGAGGKSLHIAALLQNKGKIVSLDIEAFKLKELEKRAERNKVKIIQSKWIENETVITQLKNTADRLLLDVPCTGLGVLRRNPDTKYKLTLAFLEEIKKTQAYILQTYSQMLKPQGLMVYATCSILPEENSKQIEAFIAKNNNFELVEEKKFFASVQGFDGFYMALIKKKE
ncbi:MAG: RsmB/NOP family class I SAM-dependent RNA methyltransferase [Bacteroidota bacterium]